MEYIQRYCFRWLPPVPIANVATQGAPKWRNELGKQVIDLEEFRKETEAVEFPKQDPVNGLDGPLLRLWAK